MALIGYLSATLLVALTAVDAQFIPSTTPRYGFVALNPFTERRLRQPFSCGPPPYVQHARVVATTFTRFNRSTVESDQVTYGCYDGYIILGEPTITCDPNNMQWTALPVCAVTCGMAPKVRAARYSASFIKGQSLIGSTVKYTCAIGLTIISHDTITCQSDGQWSQVPKCEYGSIIVTACPDPPDIEHGSPATRSYTTTRFTWFDKVTYMCNIGFHSEWKDPTITCQTNGTWPEPPKCIPDASCGAAPIIENGFVQDQSFVANRSAPFSTVRYGCRSGYRINGTKVIRCNPNLKWSRIPVCELINCGKPPIVANAVIFNQSFPSNAIAMDGDRVAYACQSGYFMPDQRSTIVCLFDGLWTPEPRCVAGFGNSTTNGNEITCGMAPLLSNGVISNATFDTTQMSGIADKIYYRCRDDFSLVGRDLIVCRPDTLTWTAMPQCVK